MTRSSDFDEVVTEVCGMLRSLDTDAVESNEFEEKGTPPETSDSEADSDSRQAPADESTAGESDTSPDKTSSGSGAHEESPQEEYQPHQYIIHTQTPVGPDYVVRAVEGQAYFDVIADYNLVPDVAKFYEEDSVENVSIDDLEDEHPLFLEISREALSEVETQGNEEMVARIYTAIEALDNLDEDIKGEIIYQLTEIFTTAPVKYVVESTREDGKGGIKGFEAFYRIFPYNDEFGLQDLNDVIERVRMATQRGKIFLKYSFQLDVDFGEETGGKSIQPSPPKQSQRWEME